MQRRVSDKATQRNIEDIEAYCAVVDLRSLTAAARQLRTTKGAISRRVAKLENQLGVALLRRTNRGMEPTEVGQAYRSAAGKGLAMLDDAAAAARAGRAPAGLLRVAVSEGFAVSSIAPHVAEFLNANPQVRIDLVVTSSPNFSAQHIDVAILPALPNPDSALIARKLIDWRGRFVAAPAYLDRAKPLATPRQLHEHRLLLFADRHFVPTEAVKGADGNRMPLSLKPIMTSSGTVLRQSALAGVGIAFLPSTYIDRDIRDGRLRDLFPEYDFPGQSGSTYLLYPPSRTASANVQALRDFLLDVLRASEAERVDVAP